MRASIGLVTNLVFKNVLEAGIVLLDYSPQFYYLLLHSCLLCYLYIMHSIHSIKYDTYKARYCVKMWECY